MTESDDLLCNVHKYTYLPTILLQCTCALLNTSTNNTLIHCFT